MSALGGLFLALGGLALLAFAVFAALCIASRIYLALERFVAAKLAEDSGCDWSDPDGDIPAPIQIPEVSIHDARRIKP